MGDKIYVNLNKKKSTKEGQGDYLSGSKGDHWYNVYKQDKNKPSKFPVSDYVLIITPKDSNWKSKTNNQGSQEIKPTGDKTVDKFIEF